jgi:DNA (cytosine-5)-methyltransferase 1
VLNGLDLFSGIGGITIALSEWVKPVAYCEIDRYCQAVLLSRMSEGKLPIAPIWDNIKTLDGEQFRGMVDIIYGGFPCQDISCAGNGIGLEGKRSGLFFEIMRLAEEVKPAFIFLENVPAIRTRGLDIVGKELASLGYDCRWGLISAYDMGAPHKRERWFCLSHAKSERLPRGRNNIGPKKIPTTTKNHFLSENWEKYANRVFGMDNGLRIKSHSFKALGNAVVPVQATEAFKRLMGI